MHLLMVIYSQGNDQGYELSGWIFLFLILDAYCCAYVCILMFCFSAVIDLLLQLLARLLYPLTNYTYAR